MTASNELMHLRSGTRSKPLGVFPAVAMVIAGTVLVAMIGGDEYVERSEYCQPPFAESIAYA